MDGEQQSTRGWGEKGGKGRDRVEGGDGSEKKGWGEGCWKGREDRVDGGRRDGKGEKIEGMGEEGRERESYRGWGKGEAV